MRMNEDTRSTPEKRSSYKGLMPRTVARFAMIQSIFYAMNSTDTWGTIVSYVTNDLFDETGYDVFDEGSLFVDRDFFMRLTRAWSETNRDNLNALFVDFLPKNWTLDRMEPALHAVLLCAVLELSGGFDTPRPVLVNEYLIASQAFVHQSRLVNAILDAVCTHYAAHSVPDRADT
jgi:transcription termination factor NusB